MSLRRIAFALFFCLTIPVVGAQEASNRAHVNSMISPPEIDGRLVAGEWDAASVIDDLHQVEPVEFAAPSRATTWYVMYGPEALYVAAVASEDNTDRISAQVLRQGSELESDDQLRVVVDAFNNKRSGYSFAVNPNGVREDGIYTNGNLLSLDWEGIWRTAATVREDGWSMEMAIPYNTLNFDPQNDTWGINFVRVIKRTNETIAWSSRNGKVDPTVAGELTGLRNLDQGIGLDIIPGASASSSRNYGTGDTDSEFRPSLDVNYKLTPAVSVLLTINTDFAATEVDERQLDVNRFNPVLPEKRSFFLSNFDIFQFGGISTERARGPDPKTLIGSFSEANAMPFFSRRIGLGPAGQPIDLIGGLKLGGRLGRTDFGTLYVRQDEFEDIDASDLFIARVSHGVLGESSVGAIFTAGNPIANTSNSLAGMDFNYLNTRLPGNRSLEGHVWVQSSDNEGVDGDSMAYSASVGIPALEGWEAGGQVQEVEANYYPALGYANRTGVRMYSGAAAYKWIFEDAAWLQRIESSTDWTRWDYLDTGDLQSQEIRLNYATLRNSSDDLLRLQTYLDREKLRDGDQPLAPLGIFIPAGEYDFRRHALTVETANHRAYSVMLRYDDGGYFNGDRMHIRLVNNWAVNRHLAFELEYDYNKFEFPDASAITRQITFKNTIAFDAHWSILTLAQYDNLSNDIGVNIRMRYNRAAGQDFWLVLNHNFREYPPGDPAYSGGGFDSVRTELIAKVTYTFRF